MLSRNEARQLRGVAELLRGQPSPAMLEQIATMLDTLAEDGDGKRPVAVDEQQCDLPLASAPSSSSSRPLSMSADAVRARRRREKKTCGEPARDRSTPVATAVTTGRDRGRATADNVTGSLDTDRGTAPALLDPPDPISTKIGREDPATAVATGRDRPPPRESVGVVHDAEQPPWWVFEDARSLRPDLGEFHLREMWRAFVRKRGSHTSESDARAHFGSWLPNEDVGRRQQNLRRLTQTNEDYDDEELGTRGVRRVSERGPVAPAVACADGRGTPGLGTAGGRGDDGIGRPRPSLIADAEGERYEPPPRPQDARGRPIGYAESPAAMLTALERLCADDEAPLPRSMSA